VLHGAASGYTINCGKVVWRNPASQLMQLVIRYGSGNPMTRCRLHRFGAVSADAMNAASEQPRPPSHSAVVAPKLPCVGFFTNHYHRVILRSSASLMLGTSSPHSRRIRYA